MSGIDQKPPHDAAIPRFSQPRHLRWFALAALLGSITLLASLGLLALSGHFITATAIAGGSVASAAVFDIFRPGAMIRFFAIARTAGRYGERIISHEAVLRLLADLRRHAFSRLARLAPEPLARMADGDLLQRLVSDIDTLDEAPLRVWLPWLWSLLVTAVALLLLNWAHPQLALGALPWLLMATLGLPLLLAFGARRSGEHLAAFGAHRRSELIDALRGFVTLRLSGAWQQRRADWLANDQALLQLQWRQRLLQSLAVAGITALVGLATWQTARLGHALLAGDAVSAPWLVLAILAAFGTLEAITPCAGVVLAHGRSRAAADRLEALYRLEPLLDFPRQPAEPLTAEAGNFALTMDGVHFRWPDRSVGIEVDTLCIEAGERVLVSGPSGGGKSTFAALAARMADPDRGTIRFGGHALHRFDEATLRRHIALLPQRPHLFAMTLAENLRLGDPQASDDELRAVLAAVDLQSWLAQLPDGMATPLGEYGRGLSGGEARRVATAAVLLRKAALTILDEPFEGLDPASRARVAEGIDHWIGPRSLIIATHRDVAMSGKVRKLRVVDGRLVTDSSTLR